MNNRSNNTNQQQHQQQLVFVALAAAATASLAYYYYRIQKSTSGSDEYDELGKKIKKVAKQTIDSSTSKTKNDVSATTTSKSTASSVKKSKEVSFDDATTDNTMIMDEKKLHAMIEEIDKRGKILFKNKQVNSFESKKQANLTYCIEVPK